jgi:non-ribosomal peptide synthetase-like protein
VRESAEVATVDRAEPPTDRILADVLADVLNVEQVPEDSNFFDDLGADSLLMAQFCARIRKRGDMPSVSMKDVYRHPTIRALAGSLEPAAPSAGPAAPGGLAGALATLLAEVLKVEQVPVDAHFFDDLSADSLLMAQFCARVRKRGDLPSVSMKDVYRHTTIQALAGSLAVRDENPAHGPGTAASPLPARRPAPSPRPRPVEGPPAFRPADAPMSRSRPHYVLSGLLQFLLFLGASAIATFVLSRGFDWISASPTALEIYLRSLIFSGSTFAATCLLSIVAKWTLIGRWKPRQIPVWSLEYVRFWLVKTLIRTNPLVRFAGTPLYSLYLRALGAKIGRGVAIFAPSAPVCTDLLTIGSHTVIRKDSFISGYRAVDGVIQIGPVSLGRDVYVGELTVLDIGTSMGDGAQLGYSSSLHTGQSVPAAQSWHGSPAEPTTVDYRMVRTGRPSMLRRTVLPLVQLVVLIGVTLPVSIGGLTFLFRQIPQLAAPVGDLAPAVTTWPFYLDALVLSTALFFGSIVLGLLVVTTVPRLLALIVRPDRDYPLYGIRYLAHRTISRMTNRRFFTRLFGDCSYIVYYLRGIGYDLSKVAQTGSNFGLDVKHDNPFLSAVGRGTVIADGLSFINADYSSTHFRLSRVSIGAQNFLGNRIAYPAHGRTGDNCLLATKVMVPLDGKVREGVGLLGSPSFEIPRTVDRDQQLDVTNPAELRRRLGAKTRHNTVSILLLLLSRLLLTCMLTVLTLVTFDLVAEFGAVAALAGALVLPLTTAYLLLVDRAVRRLQAHRPNGCSIYDRAFWRHERFWKLTAETYIQLFNGTPFKTLIWRLLGVRIGRQVFDDGCALIERTFVTIGDRCTLNAGSIIQCHSQEDGAFKSDRIAIGAGCTLGVGAFVHYGVTIGDGAMLAPDSFLMKGEQVPASARWGGNPAQELPEARAGRLVLRSMLSGPTPDVRLVSPNSPSRRPLSLWRPSIITLTVAAAIAVLVWAPQVLPDTWAALRDHLGAATAAMGNGDVATAGLEAAQVLALLSPVLGLAVLAAAFRRPIRPRPPAARRAEPATVELVRPAPPAAGGDPAPSLRGFLAAAVPVLIVGLLALAGFDERVATAGEAALAAGAAVPLGGALAPLSWPDMIAARQIAAVDGLLSVPNLANVVDGARIAVLVIGVVGCLLLWPVARRLRLSAGGAALAVVLCGLTGVAAGLVGSVEAGTPAALWLTIAAVLVGRSRRGPILAAGATVIAALTAPLAAVGPLVLVAHGMLTGTLEVGGRRTVRRLVRWR